MKRALRLDLAALADLRAAEVAKFYARTPKSRALYQKSCGLMPNGVPCSWMAAFWPGTEIFVARGEGGHFTDVDGHRYLDMSQCDLSMACGFGTEAIAKAVAERFAAGSHFLLPTEDAIAVCTLLTQRFAMPFWQFTLSASTANTEAFRIARLATQRDKVLIFEGKYHGHIDETLVKGEREHTETGHHGLPSGTERGTYIVPFNDLEAVEAMLKRGDVACILTEPAMTNMGVILPDEGFLPGLRALANRYGALLIIDETHTQVATYGGFTRLWNLKPDILTLGKCVGGGVPIGAYGITAPLRDLIERNTEPTVQDGKTLAIGGTTYGNALNMAAARAFIPPTGKARQRINRVAAIAMGICDKYVQAYYESTRRPVDKVWQGWLDHLGGQIASALGALNAECSAPWFLGDTMTHADIAVVCTFQAIEFDMAHMVPKGLYPRLEALCARAMELPAFAETYPSE
jgi:glutamate-1-semialdehyde aminotransferase